MGDSIVKRCHIDKWREYLKRAEPYSDDEWIDDGKNDLYRENATIALMVLKEFGLDPYDDNDYGDILE